MAEGTLGLPPGPHIGCPHITWDYSSPRAQAYRGTSSTGDGVGEEENRGLLNGGPARSELSDWRGVAKEGSSGGCAAAAPKAALLVALIVLVVSCFTLLNRDRMQLLLSWVVARPIAGAVLLVALYSIALVAMFPSAVLSLAAGAIFGIYVGGALAWLGTSIGQTLAFIAGRYLLRDIVLEHVTQRYPQWPVIDQAISKEGWKLVTLLRLSPLIPWSLLNYALSITGITFSSYTVASSISIIPWSLVFVYFGSLATTLADVIDGKSGPNAGTRTALLVGSGVLLAIIMAWTTMLTRRAIKEALTKTGADTQSVRASIHDMDGYLRILVPLPAEPSQLELSSCSFWMGVDRRNDRRRSSWGASDFRVLRSPRSDCTSPTNRATADSIPKLFL